MLPKRLLGWSKKFEFDHLRKRNSLYQYAANSRMVGKPYLIAIMEGLPVIRQHL